MHLRFTFLCVALGVASQLQAADPFAFKDGDRVVLLGSTLIEREQKSGYWELALTLKNKDKNVTFRNLGWSGDTVHGESRNGFDASPKGFERMVVLVKKLKPTVIIISYGHNESFEGIARLDRFLKGLEKLYRALPTDARTIFISPPPFEKAGRRIDLHKLNHDLDVYLMNAKELLEKHDVEYFDLFMKLKMFPEIEPPLTENGIHYGPEGYRRTARILINESTLPSTEPYERLRDKIIEKNLLFFHRWRPQNETYLYLFRKHEQGNNAVEIPQFDPLIEKAEKEIAELKKAIK